MKNFYNVYIELQFRDIAFLFIIFYYFYPLTYIHIKTFPQCLLSTVIQRYCTIQTQANRDMLITVLLTNTYFVRTPISRHYKNYCCHVLQFFTPFYLPAVLKLMSIFRSSKECISNLE